MHRKTKERDPKVVLQMLGLLRLIIQNSAERQILISRYQKQALQALVQIVDENRIFGNALTRMG